MSTTTSSTINQSIEEFDILSKYVQAVDQIAFLRDVISKKETALLEEESISSRLQKENKDLELVLDALNKENHKLIVHKRTKYSNLKRSHKEISTNLDDIQETASQYSEKYQKKQKKYENLFIKQKETRDRKNMYKSQVSELKKELESLRKETTSFLPIVPRRKLTARMRVVSKEI